MTILSELKNIKTEEERNLEGLLDELDHLEQSNPEKYKELLEKSASQMNLYKDMEEICPEAGFVIKTKIVRNRDKKPLIPLDSCKLFINICKHSSIPSPPAISDEELSSLLSGNVESTFKVPLSLSSHRIDKDSKGNTCVVVDACVHSSVIDRCRESEPFIGFIIYLAIEWTEKRLGIDVSREYIIPRMSKKGDIIPHKIRKQHKEQQVLENPSNPLIVDKTSSVQEPVILTKATPTSPLLYELEAVKTKRIPKYELILEPSDSPEYVVININLDKVSSPSKSNGTLYLEKKKLLYTDDIYKLHIDLSVEIDMEEAASQFSLVSHILTVTIPAKIK
jgi:hypothetical protein